MLILPPVLALLLLSQTLKESRAFVVPQQSLASTCGFLRTAASQASRRLSIDAAPTLCRNPSKSSLQPSTLALNFFPRRREEEAAAAAADPASSEDTKEQTSDESTATGVATTDPPNDKAAAASTGSSLPNFFARRFGGAGGGGNNSNNDDIGKAGESTAAVDESASRPTSTATATATRAAPPPPPPPPRSPEDEAKRLRSEADRMRLEAERMDAELTLQKIERLEKQITTSKKKLKPEELEAMQNQLQALQTKLFKMGDDDDSDGSDAKSSKNGTSGSSSTSSTSTNTMKSTTTTMASSITASQAMEGPVVVGGELPALMNRQKGLAKDEVEEVTELLDAAPDLLKKLVAAATDYEYNSTINTTDLTLVLAGFLAPDKPPPVFPLKRLAEREEEIRSNRYYDSPVLDEVKRLLTKDEMANTTRVALLTLEYEYYFVEDTQEVMLKNLEKNLDRVAADEPWLMEVLNKSAADATIESLYPKGMRDQGPEPSEAAVRQLVEDLKSNGIFVATQKPDKVSGGYVVRGQSKKADGDELVRSIDAMLEGKPNLQNSLNVFYTQDFGVFLDPDAFEAFDPDDVPPILYITGPNIVRPPRPVQLSVASAAGLATCWYLAIYPFLLNPVIAKRVEDQLALADAGMTPDLNWLSQLSLPLFFTFVGLQLVGEAGHQAMAAANKVKLSVPTFVPSLITGITSTVTTFKTPPPNKTAMFDIAVAGPLLGILASLVAVAVGSSMTLTTDPSLLPALPLEILRQSTLGGGIINSILGNGALSIPEGAQGTAAVAGITIPLHPVAVAGYISLIVNALSLLPIGTTDGGRMALAVFGRGAKLLIGNIFLTALFVVGILGSDLFLFYFGFITLFQTGNEIAAKNEVDKVDFSRVIMAIAAYVLMVLTLTPFQ